MSKIIKIEDGIVLIGTNDGGIDEVRLCDLQFSPQIGDEVEIFKTENRTLVTKVIPALTLMYKIQTHYHSK